MRRRPWLIASLVASAVVAVVVALPVAAQRTGARTGVSRTAAFTLTSSTVECLSDHFGRFRAWGCFTPVGGSDLVYVVDPTDTDASEGRGPFCDAATCHTALMGNETSDACFFSTAAVELRCEVETE